MPRNKSKGRVFILFLILQVVKEVDYFLVKIVYVLTNNLIVNFLQKE